MEATKEKHATITPGPWYLSSIDGVEDSLMVGGGDDGSDIVADIRDEKDARLIAAAPDLLEQCKLFEKVLKAIGDMGYRDEIEGLDSLKWLMRIMELREVLAKVDGGEG